MTAIVFTTILLLGCVHAALCAPVKSCLWNGSYYDAGESLNRTVYHLNDSASLCEMCLCREEGIVCVNETCAVPAGSSGTAPPLTAKGSCSAIDDSGRVILEGETYNPIIPGVGIIQCVTCNCVAGANGTFVSRCAKQTCPPPPPCGENPPVEEYTPCCPACVPVYLTNSTPTPPPSPFTLATCRPDPALTQNVYIGLTGDSVAIENTQVSTVSLFAWEINRNYTVTAMPTQKFYETSFEGMKLVGKCTLASRAQLDTSAGMAALSACTSGSCSQATVVMLHVVPISALC